MKLSDIYPIIQMAIGPVILISGIGLLLLSMNNRLARVIDRSREIAAGLSSASDGEDRTSLVRQIDVLYRRGRLMRTAIALASASILFAALLITSLFVAAVFALDLIMLVGILFVAALTCLVCSLVPFIRDVNLSLDALEIELRQRV